MIRVTYIISSIDKALEFEQVAEKIDRSRFELSFILLNPGGSALESFVQKQGLQAYRVAFHGKKDLLSATLKIRSLLKKIKPQIVHVHLFEASLAGLTAAKLAGVKRRISTRHHSDFHHTYFPDAVKYDKLINRLSTEIIAISNVVKQILITKENVNENKITLIHHGIERDLFDRVSETGIQQLKEKYNPENRKPVIGVISRYIELKGIQYIIPAFKKLLTNHPEALLILANSKGDYTPQVRKLLSELPAASYREIEFEKEIHALYRLFDIFVHVPTSLKGEAFGQTYIEALASGIPSVFTLSGIAGDMIVHEQNGLVVPYKDSDAIYEAMERILKGDEQMKEMIRNGKKIAAEQFSVEKKIHALEELYLKQK